MVLHGVTCKASLIGGAIVDVHCACSYPEEKPGYGHSEYVNSPGALSKDTDLGVGYAWIQVYAATDTDDIAH